MTRHTWCKSALGVAALLVTNALSRELPAADYKPAAGPLMTKWAKDVSPEKVWPEYPRPQMVRKDWVNLNGLWDYAIVSMARIADASGHKHDGSAMGAPQW